MWMVFNLLHSILFSKKKTLLTLLHLLFIFHFEYILLLFWFWSQVFKHHKWWCFSLWSCEWMSVKNDKRVTEYMKASDGATLPLVDTNFLQSTSSTADNVCEWEMDQGKGPLGSFWLYHKIPTVDVFCFVYYLFRTFHKKKTLDFIFYFNCIQKMLSFHVPHCLFQI